MNICRIMFAGPHSIGKSATAEKLAERFPEFLYCPSIAGRIAKDTGFDLNADPSPEEVLNYQELLLERFIEHYRATEELPTIYDRSPLDFAAYATLGTEKTATLYKRLVDYRQKCIASTGKYCDVLIIPEADLESPYEDKFNRPKFSKEQIEFRRNFHSLVTLYARSLEYVRLVIVPKEFQFNNRVDYIADKLEELKAL